MVENKTIGVGAITAILLVSLGFVLAPGDNAFCEDRNITYHCDSFSQYYGLSNGKCVNNLLPNKVCHTGWVGISYDTEPEIQPESNTMKYKKILCYSENEGGCVNI